MSHGRTVEAPLAGLPVPNLRHPGLPAVAVLVVVAFWLIHLTAQPQPRIDTAAFWTAGRMWATGLNPYGSAFRAYGLAEGLGRTEAPPFWLYPPQWWWLCRPLALLSIADARAVWSAASGFATAFAFGLVAWGARATPRPLDGAVLALCLQLITFSSPLYRSIYLGQTGALTLLGCALLFAGRMRSVPGLTAAGLILLLLKPQIGAVLLALLLILPGDRRAAVWALALSALAALAPFVSGSGDLIGSARAFLAGTARYGEHVLNAPAHTTGLNHVLAALGVVPLPPLLLPPLAATLTAALLARLPAEERWSTAEGWTIALVLPTFVLSLHDYDLLPALIPLLLADAAGWRRAVALGGGAIVALAMPLSVAVGAEITLATRYSVLTAGLVALLALAFVRRGWWSARVAVTR